MWNSLLQWRNIGTRIPVGKNPLEQLGATTPPPVWPEEVSRGLWNLPSSTFSTQSEYGVAEQFRPERALTRFSKGIEAAARLRSVFHF
jgi:hypothetical protein